ncbi:MAG TPA: hypothetical protein VGS18_01830 [Thermoplasmata archaeon]|nr:hypothetical protein [Thermoplasmata archaeon]
MTCRFDNADPRKCDRCGAFLWVVEEGLFCAECGVSMPCSMRVLPPPPRPGELARRG